jgi:hypothetical protein
MEYASALPLISMFLPRLRCDRCYNFGERPEFESGFFGEGAVREGQGGRREQE